MPLDLLRVLLSIVMLAYASIMDLRTREVTNWVWVVFAPLGILINIYEGLFVKVLNPFMIFLPVLVGTGLSLAFFYIGLYGGADAKAFITLFILNPSPSDLIIPFFGIVSTIYPLTLITNSAIIAVLFAFSLLFRNLFWRIKTQRSFFNGLEGEPSWKKLLVLMSCVKVETRIVRGPPYQYPTEIVEDTGRRIQLMPDVYDDEAALRTLRILKKDLELGEIWISPTLPFLLFISFGFLCSLILGDIALWVFNLI
jgi:preflagellin peptidase FlaK